jgi:hypothetical protein
MISFFVFRVFAAAPLLAAQVQPRDVHFTRARSALPPVCPLELRPLRRAEQPPAPRYRLERVLREEERVVLAQPRAFALDVAGVSRIELGDGSPIGGEMTADAVAPLEVEVRLHRALEEGRVVPGRAVVDGSRAGGRRHGPELTVELLGVGVLRLVDLEQEARGVADDVG